MSEETLSPAPPIPHRILVRGVNWLGDAIMTTPALQRLREAHPSAEITLLIHQSLADLWLHHAAVDAVITFAPGEGVWSVAAKLRGRRFEVALILPNSPRSALEAWLARIPKRIGYARPWRNWFLSMAVSPRPGRVQMRKRSVSEIRQLVSEARRRQTDGFPESSHAPALAHQVHEYLHLVSRLGANAEPIAPRLEIAAQEVEAARQKFGLTGAGPWLGLNPGAQYGPAKRWPAERFVEAAAELQRRTHGRWLIFGGRSDVELTTQIVAGVAGRTASTAPPLNLAGKTTLRELCALLKLCDVLVTNDSGPMHVAAAVGTPVVVPFGSTSPELTGPGLPGAPGHRLLKAAVPCAPCFRRECPIDFRCMKAISVDQVVQAALEVLTQER